MKINSSKKGPVGEREFGKWITELLDLDEPAKRKLGQAREGGLDFEIGHMYIEVKRREQLALRDWWIQAKKACGPEHLPVVAYRQNRQKWRILLSASHVGLQHGFIVLEPEETKRYLIKSWEHYLHNKRFREMLDNIEDKS